MSGFASLGLAPHIVEAADDMGFNEPTAIQAGAIPAVLDGYDVQGAAATGSGKTAAYALPVMQLLEAGLGRPRRRPQVLVLVPTRELAVQVSETLLDIADFLDAPSKITTLVGGVSINPQLMGLRGGTDLVVATPGRLLDVVDQNALDLSAVACLVLDEADRLLDEGFAEELKHVLALLPSRRQNLLFSATFPDAVQALADRLLQAPIRVDITGDATQQADIEQHAIEVDTAQRTPLLRHMIAQGQWTRVLVFVATRYACDHVAEKLNRAGIKAEAFHGDSSQGARTRVLDDFKAGTTQVLVATDLGARGIHIAQLPVVVNYDLPRSAVDYTHRIGRTGRAGAKGLAVSFIPASAEAHFRLIEKRQGQRVTRERIAGFEPTEVAAPSAEAPAGTGGVKGRRPSKKDKLRAAAAAAAAEPSHGTDRPGTGGTRRGGAK